LDVSLYGGKAVIISDNNGYQTRVIETLENEVVQALKEMLSGNQD